MNFFKRDTNLFIGLLMLLAVGIYVLYDLEHYRRKGVYAVAKVVGTDPEGDATQLIVFLHGKQYATVVGTGCSYCIGSYYWVQTIADDPKHARMYRNMMVPVPPCVLDRPLPENGFTSLPGDSCK